MRNSAYDHFERRFGFEFGAARVTRVFGDEQRGHTIAIDTPFHRLQIGVSPTGRSVRIFIDGDELVEEKR